MSRALVATSATSGLSLLFHALRFLSAPSDSAPDPVVGPSFLESPLDQICPAERSESGPSVQLGVHLPSLLVGILVGLLLVPFCEAVLTARILLFRAALRRLGFSTRAPLYRLL